MIYEERQEEKMIALMMDALDGELSRAGQLELETLLLDEPELAREWAMMQAIDVLFKETPMLQPAPSFAQRTLARLPNHRARMLALAGVFVFMLMTGFLPVVGVAWFSGNYGSALSEPAVLSGVSQAFAAILNVIEVVLQGSWQLLMAIGQQAIQNRLVWGWVAVMVGVVLLWGGVYGQLVRQPQRVYLSNR
jgi:hypothetical protein